MIVRLRGTLLERTDDGVVVEAGGVGYEVSLCPSACLRLPPAGGEVLLFIVESTAMYGGGTSLYGFLSAEERRLFNVFRDGVPGTGAKKAMEFLDKAAKSPPDFRRAILDKDAKALVALFGFTAKTAEKLVAALPGKLERLPITDGAPARAPHWEEAVAGLVALGYRESEARAAVQSARGALDGGGQTSEAIIRESLRHLSGRGA